MQDILILGGTGFVGRSLCALLAASEQAPQLTVPTRHMSQEALLRMPRPVALFSADIGDPSQLVKLVEGKAAVVNLVAILHGDDTQFARVHVDLVRSLVEACKSTGVRRIVHVSALGVDSGRLSRYLRSKAAGETVLEGSGLDVTVLRMRWSRRFYLGAIGQICGGMVGSQEAHRGASPSPRNASGSCHGTPAGRAGDVARQLAVHANSERSQRTTSDLGGVGYPASCPQDDRPWLPWTQACLVAGPALFARDLAPRSRQMAGWLIPSPHGPALGTTQRAKPFSSDREHLGRRLEGLCAGAQDFRNGGDHESGCQIAPHPIYIIRMFNRHRQRKIRQALQ